MTRIKHQPKTDMSKGADAQAPTDRPSAAPVCSPRRYEDSSRVNADDIQHAFMEVDLETSRKLCKAMRLPEKFADFCGDDRGNVVDFYDRGGKIAELDREAEWQGKYDQSVFRRTNRRAGAEFMAWLAESPWHYVVTEIPEENVQGQ